MCVCVSVCVWEEGGGRLRERDSEVYGGCRLHVWWCGSEQRCAWPCAMCRAAEMLATGQGHDSTAGLAKRCGLLSAADSEAIYLLKAAGAVPFCRTNTPQTNLSYGCSNPIFGATCHPMDETRTPGGSSGGEAALMALGGSILGLGTDIGGSVRVPAAFCGVCGFKPSGGRITKKGYFSVLAGQSGVTPAFGPMAPEVPAIAECMAALTGLEDRPDATVAPVPWNWGSYSATHKLRIGYYVADGFIAATPACVQAVHQACDMLRARGHDVVQFRPPCVIEGLHLFIKLLTADGGKAVSDALQDEVIDDSLRAFVQGVRVSGSFWKGSLLPRLLRRKGMVRSASLLEAQGRCSTSDLWDAQAQRMMLASRWETAMAEAGVVSWVPTHLLSWAACASTNPTLYFSVCMCLRVSICVCICVYVCVRAPPLTQRSTLQDVLVCPAHVMLAPAPHVVASSGITLCYTQIFNVLDFPAGTVPVASATPQVAPLNAYAHTHTQNASASSPSPLFLSLARALYVSLSLCLSLALCLTHHTTLRTRQPWQRGP